MFCTASQFSSAVTCTLPGCHHLSGFWSEGKVGEGWEIRFGQLALQRVLVICYKYTQTCRSIGTEQCMVERGAVTNADVVSVRFSGNNSRTTDIVNTYVFTRVPIVALLFAFLSCGNVCKDQKVRRHRDVGIFLLRPLRLLGGSANCCQTEFNKDFKTLPSSPSLCPQIYLLKVRNEI